jgi:hypothetical protein
MKMITLSDDALSQTLKQAKNEIKSGLCDVFTAKLERLAMHISANHLTPAESAELLEQEAEAFRSQQRGDI